ncbi:GAF domain-containing protein [Tumebacillus lipolyticus]|uniref:GAF domain-containing protein n=1 Tax=Tumebacillus lipolyticus TaxID=1280370 RepID=A0ABW4ZWU5_9BACL
MLHMQEQIQQELDSLRRFIGVDFVALALTEPLEHTIRFQYVSGNRNDRYKRIVLRPGIGLAGKVIRMGRPILMHFTEPQSLDDPREYPILLAEGLKSVAGVPMEVDGRVLGMMLVGSRTYREFIDNDVAHISQKAHQFTKWLQLLPDFA